MEQPRAREADLGGLAEYVFKCLGGHNKCAERDIDTDASKALESDVLPLSSRSRGEQDGTAAPWLVTGLPAPGLAAQSCVLLPCEALGQTPGRQHAASQRRSARILGTSVEAHEKRARPPFPSLSWTPPADQVEGFDLNEVGRLGKSDPIAPLWRAQPS